MAWQSTTINPTVTTPADDIAKIKNDLQVLRGVLGGTADADVPLTAVTGATVNSIAVLRTVVASSRPSVFVLGYYAPGDGGGGRYFYDAADTTSTDNGGTVIVGASGARWKLCYSSSIHIRQFGAIEGTSDSSAAIQACVNAVVASGKQAKILMWGEYSVGSPITFPACHDITIEGGDITHLSTFSTTGYTFTLSSTSARSNERIHFDMVSIDCNFRGGGILLDNGFKCSISRCHVQHFKTRAYWIKESSGAHEVFVNTCWAMEYTYDDGAVAYNGPWYGTGLDIEPNDCKVDTLISYFTGTPLRVDSQYNSITNCHLGTGTIYFTSNSSFCRFHGNYVDMGMLQIDNPWHIKIQDNQFLHATSNTSAVFIKLKPLSAGQYIYGVDISGNSFQNNVAATMHSILVDTSSGGFAAGGVGQCRVDGNSFVNTTVRTTRQRKRLYSGPTTSYVFSADQFPFGVVQHVTSSFAPVTAGVAVAHGLNISGNTVTMTLASSVSGTAHVEMDCNVE